MARLDGPDRGSASRARPSFRRFGGRQGLLAPIARFPYSSPGPSSWCRSPRSPASFLKVPSPVMGCCRSNRRRINGWRRARYVPEAGRICSVNSKTEIPAGPPVGSPPGISHLVSILQPSAPLPTRPLTVIAPQAGNPGPKHKPRAHTQPGLSLAASSGARTTIRPTTAAGRGRRQTPGTVTEGRHGSAVGGKTPTGSRPIAGSLPLQKKNPARLDAVHQNPADSLIEVAMHGHQPVLGGLKYLGRWKGNRHRDRDRHVLSGFDDRSRFARRNMICRGHHECIRPA